MSKAEVVPGTSRFSYTLGAGTGRFLDKSPWDKLHGKGNKGTGVFGNFSYTVIPALGFGVEWTGMNLAVTSTINPGARWPSIFLGVTDLTRYTSDKPAFIAGIGYSFYLKR